jgi:tetratricopeptide (TPR) repeat protein
MWKRLRELVRGRDPAVELQTNLDEAIWLVDQYRRLMQAERHEAVRLGRNGRMDEALRHLQEANHLKRTQDMYFWIARRLETIRRRSQLQSAMEHANEINDRVGLLISRLGVSEPDKAIQEYEAAIDRSRDAIEEMDPDAVEEAVDGVHDEERTEPRYENLREELAALLLATDQDTTGTTAFTTTYQSTTVDKATTEDEDEAASPPSRGGPLARLAQAPRVPAHQQHSSSPTTPARWEGRVGRHVDPGGFASASRTADIPDLVAMLES